MFQPSLQARAWAAIAQSVQKPAVNMREWLLRELAQLPHEWVTAPPAEEAAVLPPDARRHPERGAEEREEREREAA